MAASVDNRQFMDPSAVNGVPGLLRPIKPGPVVRHLEPPSLIVHDSSFVHDSSSEDEEDEEEASSYASYIEEIIFKSREGGIETTVLDPRDELTADDWVERHPSMVRLTGKHPFNAEAPLDRLLRHGFITPVPLHYVRNHGYVPKATWRDWTVEITGLVKRPRVFTMEQLVSEFPSRELPVTLVCAGNRRREQNMAKQTKGFNWGAAGVSTSVWRGVPLHAVLKKCGILKPSQGALNVCFEGGEDLPGGGGSKYGTSLGRGIAMDPSRDIILAYMQNGELLKPDHGFPVRMIIPGHIGGRMVKWLKRIVVTPKESDNYYHYKDNRVLPSHVDDLDLADAEGWWYKPEHIINELNVNSVITTPGHDEMLPISTWTMQKEYTVRGYAYSGGGRKVTRVEVTLDGGETWRVCKLDHPERPSPHGKYWCWCFWRIEVEVIELLVTKEIAVRAWDESHNTQPEKLIWNLMGMMNNCWFRVKANVRRPHQGEVGIVFEHPTVPGNQQGGWMAKQKPSESEPTMKKSVSTPLMVTSTEKFPMSVVRAHNKAESPWIIIHGHVYDCTQFLKDHPGGVDSILINAGTDCTEEFDAIHSDKAKALLEKYRIGELLTTGYTSDSTFSTPNSSVHGQSNFSHLAPITEVVPAPACSVALIPGEKIRCKLVKKTVISHDVRLFRFALPSEDQVFGLPVGKHVFLCTTIDGKLCMRAYTPTSDIDEVGYFELLIKIYFKNVHPGFPNGGLMSQYLESLPLNSFVEVKGPLGHIEYTGRGKFLVHGKPRYATKLAMVCGGTGITPIYQVIQAIMKDPEDRTEMYVVYANRTEDDILLWDQLNEWSSKDKRLKVWYVVENSVREGWKYSLGRINEEIMGEHLPPGSDETLALACGPPGMIQFGAKPILEKMKYDLNDSFLVF